MNARLPIAADTAAATPTARAPYALDAQQPIGQIAVHLPGATAVFRRHKLDFCCGGQVSLAQAAADRGLDCNALLQALAGLQRDSALPASVDASDTASLIAHILQRYHAVQRAQLPELVRMARRVEAVHRHHPEVPAGLADLLETAEQDLLSHMLKEENMLFPMLLAGGNSFVSMPLAVMRAEHSQHGAMLERLMQCCNNAEPPQGACNTWRALYAGIAQLHEDLVQHIHLENNILFQQFDAPAATAAPARASSPCCGACG